MRDCTWTSTTIALVNSSGRPPLVGRTFYNQYTVFFFTWNRTDIDASTVGW